MKIFSAIRLLLVVVLASTVHYGYSQTGCSSISCISDTLIISTGYDHSTGTIQSPISQDANWDLVSVPSNSPVTPPSPSWVITPNGAWSTFPNGAWVSPFQTNAYNINNPYPTYDPFLFENCFCLCQATTVRIKFDVMADDEARVYLDGVEIANGLTGYHFQYNNRIIVDTTVLLAAGTHCLGVGLYNISSVAMGFAVDGYVSGASLLSAECCNPLSSICGTKFNDLNCDGVVTSSDPGLLGWTIELRDAGGTVIATDVTDATGGYCFDGLVSGTYTVSEQNQAGWTQTFPAAPGTHTIALGVNDAVLANFGNCQQGGGGSDPCKEDVGFEAKVIDCAAQFTPYLPTLSGSWNIVSTTWTFGDGFSSNELNPTHFYDAAGNYNVCLSVTYFNGEECCTVEWCREISIEKECSGDCEFEIEITGKPSDLHPCTYDFTSIINYAGAPIKTWYWDFGDGTTGTGSAPSHKYCCSGEYNVCLYIFAEVGEGKEARCCWTRVCTTIYVECDPCEKGKSEQKTSNAQETQNDLQLFPNPNNGTFNLVFESTVVGNGNLTIMDLGGRVVHSESLGMVSEGLQNFSVNAELPAGSYICNLVVGSESFQQRMVIE